MKTSVLTARFVSATALQILLVNSTICLGASGRTTAGYTARPDVQLLPARVRSLFEKTKPICFSRFLMEVPATATVVYGPAEVDTPIEYFKGQSSKIGEHVASRLVEVESEREFLLKDDVPKLPMFGKVIDGKVPGQKIIFGSRNQIGYTIYSFVPVGNDLFIQHLNSVLPQYDRVATMNAVAANLHQRAEGKVPLGIGTCIDGAFVPLEQKYERVTVGIRIAEFPDVHFSVEVHKNQDRLAESGRLELMRDQAREEATNRGLGSVFARIKILRREPRQLGDWNGLEIATRTPANGDDTEAHEFRFQSLGTINDALQPLLDVRSDSGVYNNRRSSVKPSISDEEAIALWDVLTKSIRIRPLNGKGHTLGPSKAPLATLVGTGVSCPQTGWWQCTEGDNVQDGKRQYFTEGESMPDTVLLREAKLWQTLTCNRPQHSPRPLPFELGYPR